MPNYEYECVKCAHRFEIWQSVGEAAPPCPECASEVKKVFHPPRVIFKGSGFYVTDLRAEKESKSGAKSSSGGSEASESKAEGAKAEGANGSGAASTETKESAPKAESSPAASSAPKAS